MKSILLQLFEREIQQREERKLNLLLTQATLPKVRETHLIGKIYSY